VGAVSEWLRECAREFAARADELDALDRILGDADHGTNMRRGTESALTIDLTGATTAAEALRLIGMELVSTVGGASGPLFGTFFLRAGALWPATVTPAGVSRALRAGLNGVVTRRHARVGDKTMVDALAPAVDAFDDGLASGGDLGEALRRAAEAAEAGRDATVDMVAKRGRAALLGERSVGTMDPGAVSMALILATAAKHIR
jgi:dihydroxyacetone kinase-like protein